MIDYVECAKDGTWPVAGGVLDNTTWFRQAYRLIRGEQRLYEVERGKDDARG